MKKIMGFAVFLSLIVGGGIATLVNFDESENTYFCQDTNEICIGTHLSGGKQTRCYNQIGDWWEMPECKNGWEIYNYQPIKSITTHGKKWKCDVNGCERIEGYPEEFI